MRRDEAPNSRTSGIAPPGYLVLQTIGGLLCLAWLALNPTLEIHHGIQLWLGLSALSLFALVGKGGRLSDWITLARTGGVIATLTLASVFDPTHTMVAVIVGIALVLDRVDGAVARLKGATERGAVLDMESDQLVVFSMAVFAVAARSHPTWVLLLPAFKYLDCLFRVARNMPAGVAKPNPDGNLRARLVCAITMLALYGAVTTILPGGITSVLTALSVGLLGWSFYEDFRWQRLAEKGRARA